MNRHASMLLVSFVSVASLLPMLSARAGILDPVDRDFSGQVNFEGPILVGDQVMTNKAAALNMAGVGPQIDTNSTTTTTNYTPRQRGDALQGSVGGTSTVWFAWGTTVNDWKTQLPFPGTLPAETVGLLTAQTNFTASGSVTTPSTAGGAITNAQAISMASRYVQISAVTALTNALLANPSLAGDTVTLVNISTNSITIPKGANLSATSNSVLSNLRSVMTFWAQTLTNWVPTNPSAGN